MSKRVILFLAAMATACGGLENPDDREYLKRWEIRCDGKRWITDQPVRYPGWTNHGQLVEFWDTMEQEWTTVSGNVQVTPFHPPQRKP